MDVEHIEKNGLEIVGYDKPDFPALTRKNHACGPMCFSLAKSHWHDDVEFVSVLSGSILYSINGTIVTIHAGEGIFINSRRFHYILSDNGVECSFLCAVLHPSLLCSSHSIHKIFIEPLIENSTDFVFLRCTVPWHAEILDNVSEICESTVRPDYELSVLIGFAQIWRLLLRNMDLTASASACNNAKAEPLKQMISFIHEHYSEQITLEDIAKAGGVGKTACTAIFKKYAGSTPVSFLMRYRNSKAAELLHSTDMTVTEIAYETGFSGASYFAENFRKIMGCSPTKYRKANRKDGQ